MLFTAIVNIKVTSTRLSSSALKSHRIPPAVIRFADAVIRRADILGSTQIEALREALMLVPRDQFLEERYKTRALEDSRLPSGFGKFSPAPYILVRMLALARIFSGASVLELDCGSGYASALMCVLGARVFAVEEVGLRAQSTRKHLDQLGFNRVLVSTGYLAWADSAPFDAIISHTPLQEEKIDQLVRLLGRGGRLIAPTSDTSNSQITLIELKPSGPVTTVV